MKYLLLTLLLFGSLLTFSQTVVTNQLRYGSLVQVDGKIRTVISIINSDYDGMPTWLDFEETITGCYVDEVKAIPLTKEWLIKLGFVQPKGRQRQWFTPVSAHLVLTDMGNGRFYSKLLRRQIKTVHELQLVYFATEEKELQPGN